MKPIDEIMAVINGESEGCVVEGDCLELMDRANGAIGCIVTSPPYNVGKSYEDTDGEWYPKLLRGLLSSGAAAVGPGRFLFINTNDRLVATSTRRGITPVTPILYGAALRAGLSLYDRRVWVKDPAWMSCPWHGSSYKAVDEFEYCFMFRRDGPLNHTRQRLSRSEWAEWGSRGVWSFPSVMANRLHPAQFPQELPRRAIRLLSDPGDIILDPFCGSGTTCVAAKKLGRKYIGIEISPEYAEIARNRVASTPKPLFCDGDDHDKDSRERQGSLYGGPCSVQETTERDSCDEHTT